MNRAILIPRRKNRGYLVRLFMWIGSARRHLALAMFYHRLGYSWREAFEKARNTL